METTDAVYRLALEVEATDGRPDNLCPECGQDIAGWEGHEAHFVPSYQLSDSGRRQREHAGVQWPFTHDTGSSPFARCRFDRDLLCARTFRRRYIAAHKAALAVSS